MIQFHCFELTLLQIAITAMILMVGAEGHATPRQEALARADSVFQSRSYEDARKLYENVLADAKNANDSSVQMEALSQMARCYLIAGDKQNARKFLTQAETMASPGYPLGWSRYLGVRGRWEWKNDSLRQAAKTFEEMFTYCREHKLTSRAIDAVHMIAIVGTPEEQVKWGLMGIEEAEKSGEQKWLGPLWNNLAATYSDLRDYEKSYESYLKAREYHWRYGDETSKLYADYQVGWVLRMKGDYDQALTWLRPALAWAERLENNDVIGQASQDIGEIMIAKGDKAKGLEYLRLAEECYAQGGYSSSNPDILAKVRERIAELSK